MRKAAPLLAYFLSFGAAFAADSLVPRHSLNMEAAVMSSGGSSIAKTGLRLDPGGKPLGGGWTTAQQRDYSQKRNKESAIGLDVQVRNVGRTADQAKLDWFFFARPVKDGDLYIFDRGSKDITVDASSTLKVPLESKALHSSTVKQLHTTNGVNALGNHIPPSASVQKRGSVVGGWIVRLIVDGDVAVVRASSPSLEARGKNDDHLGGGKVQAAKGKAKGKK
jgi:hypothetical protein